MVAMLRFVTLCTVLASCLLSSPSAEAGGYRRGRLFWPWVAAAAMSPRAYGPPPVYYARPPVTYYYYAAPPGYGYGYAPPPPPPGYGYAPPPPPPVTGYAPQPASPPSTGALATPSASASYAPSPAPLPAAPMPQVTRQSLAATGQGANCRTFQSSGMSAGTTSCQQPDGTWRMVQ